MGPRPGQLDPGVVLYLFQEKGMSADQIQKLLYNECGLKGLSGISNTLSGEGDGSQTTHEEVLEAGRVLVPRMMTVIRGVLSAA